MNILNIYTKSLMLAMTVFGAVSLTSCEDQPDKFEATSGVPTVKFVRCLSTEIHTPNDAADMQYTNGQLVTSAAAGSTVAIVGENMRSVNEVWFNDKKGTLNPSTLTDNVLITSISADVPKEVTNKIYLKTKAGDVVEYDFTVKISQPQISAMPCEYEKVGSTVRLTGNYFVDDPNVPLTCAFTGADGSEIPAQIKAIDENYRYIDVVIPQGASSGPVVCTSIYGKGYSSFYYMDNRNILFDNWGAAGEPGTGLTNHGWHAQDILNDEWSLDGSYLDLTGAMTADGAWNDGEFSFEYWPGSWEGTFEGTDKRLSDLFPAENYEKMAVKFEMCVPAANPWQAGGMQVIFSGDKEVTLPTANNTFFNDGPKYPRAIYQPWASADSKSYDTGDKWVTVTLPIATEFVYDFDGSTTSNSLTKDSFTGLTIFVWAGGKEGTDCTPSIKIDNIRVVPIK